MFERITRSLPSISATLDEERRTLVDRLPSVHRGFLEAHNGGHLPEGRYTFPTGVPFKTPKVDNPSRDDCVVELFGLGLRENDDDPSDLLEKNDAYREEDFLPQDVIAIGRCVQSSLVCMSLRADTFGAIYYWDYYWRYPWCEPFFRARIDAAAKEYPGASAILKDTSHAQHQALKDALNFATLMRLAADFEAFGAMCRDASAG